MQARQQNLNGMNGLTPAELGHWSRVQAALLGGFSFWSKPKINPDLVEQLAGELADKAVLSFRNRARTGKRNGRK